MNAEAPIRYYETVDWGEGSPDDGDALTNDGNGHPVTALATDLNAIDLNSNPLRSGSRQLAPRSKGRKGPTTTNLYPIFSSESPSSSSTNGFISINVEFINGTTANNLLSSSSFNYTISPRR